MPADMLAVGAHVGDYVIEALLGQGGMASVYRARHAVLDTEHALKILDPKLRDDDEVRARFLEEAKIQAKHLNHPGIVKVTTIVANADHAALVMELVDGTSLEAEATKLVDRPDEIRRIMAGVLAAVGHAHDKGIVHRDLKPANVLLAGPERAPKVSDFGIAKVTRDTGTPNKKSTHAATRMGTLSYMSPEQVKRAKDVTPRSDIWSLGAMLYELATGRLPFDGESDYELMDQIVRGQYMAPDETNVKVDPVIAAVIKRALALDPAARFASCADMASALASSSKPSETPPPTRSAPSPSVPASIQSEPSAQPVSARVFRGWLVLPVLAVTALAIAGIWMASRSKDSPPVASVEDARADEKQIDANLVDAAAVVDAMQPDAGAADAGVVLDVTEARKALWHQGTKGSDRSNAAYRLPVTTTVKSGVTTMAFQIMGLTGRMRCTVEWGADGNPTALTRCSGSFKDSDRTDSGTFCGSPRDFQLARVPLSCTRRKSAHDEIRCTGDVRHPYCGSGWTVDTTKIAIYRLATQID